MSDWWFIAWSYALVIAAVVFLAVRSAQRGRRLARQVPESDRRWM